MDMLQAVKDGKKRPTAKMISLVENRAPGYEELLKEIYLASGKAFVIGITGPPGAGKSTLTDQLVKHYRQQDKEVAVIAVDPTSPFTGGSILGDRIRMGDIATDPKVFIRSMGTRGHLGGLSESTSAAVMVLDVYGADVILVETVGVGQSEVEIVRMADTTVMVMVPGLGDDIQAMKAGIMEIGDVFTINKADREGAERTKTEIEMMLSYTERAWTPPVSLVSALNRQGIDTLVKDIEDHRQFMITNGLLKEKKRENLKQQIEEIMKDKVLRTVKEKEALSGLMDDLIEETLHKKIDPYSAAQMLLEKITL